MTRILLYQNPQNLAPKWPPLRQTFLGRGFVYGDKYEYVIDDKVEADYFLTVAGGEIPEFNNIPKQRRVAILMENPSIWTPSIQYLDYFGVVLSPSSIPVPHNTRLLISQPAVSWFYGLGFRTDRGLSHEPVLENYLQLDDLASIPIPSKTRLLSCVVSSKGSTVGHSWRVSVAEEIERYFGHNVDMFGFGWNPISDKREAIDPYLFTLVMENESREHYWTEKLSDAILGYSQPIYSGAPNVLDYFSHEFPVLSYGVDPKLFAVEVARLLEKMPFAVALYERRQQIMYEHNVFYYIAGLIRDGIL